tara:strand:+ start:174 stop:398 length:225 start_codon:yes stop_codon:yes gene_type:complete
MNNVIKPSDYQLEELQQNLIKLKMQAKMKNFKHNRLSLNGKETYEMKIKDKEDEKKKIEELEKEKQERLREKKT